jgi:hypothetical protein
MVKRYTIQHRMKLLQFDENAPAVKQQQWQVANEYEKYGEKQRSILGLGN